MLPWLAGAREDFQRVFLPYMGMVAFLIKWPGPFEQTFLPPCHWCSIWDLALAGPVVIEKMLKSLDDRWKLMIGWLTGACLYYKLSHEPKGSGELISSTCICLHHCWEILDRKSSNYIVLYISLSVRWYIVQIWKQASDFLGRHSHGLEYRTHTSDSS